MGLYLLVSGDFVTTGGMDRANYALASYLARAGHEVHLVAFRVGEGLLRMPNVQFHRVPKPANSYTLALPLLDRAGRRWARRVAARGGRVVVNGGCCQWGDVNWVHYVHAAHSPEARSGAARRLATWWNHRKWLAEERRALRAARTVVVNSDRTRRDVIERVGVPPERVRVVYYGSDPDAFRPATPHERLEARRALRWPEDRPVVAFVGAMSDRRKGFDTLFEAWKRLCRDPGWDADLAVIGAGAELPAWRSRARRDGLASRIRFLGFHGDVASVLRACDALAAPSRYEAYGLAVHEALCCGLPAVVSAGAGVAERVPPGLRELLLPDPEDAADLAARLRLWHGRRSHFAEAAAEGSATLRTESWDEMAQRMTTALDEKSADTRRSIREAATSGEALPPHRQVGRGTQQPAVDLSVVVVNWNSLNVTADALRSLREHTHGISYEVTVLDNNSTADQSAHELPAMFPWVRFVANARNLGFSRANNIGIGMSTGRYVLLLNNDTRQTGNALGEAVRYLDEHPRVGALGILHRNDDAERSVQPSAFRFPRPWKEILGILGIAAGREGPDDHTAQDARDVDWVCGSFLMIRRECLEAVGLLDERFFMFDEDIDWCRRAARQGWKVRFWPGTSMIHLGSATAGKVADKNFSMFRSRLTYVRKNHSRLAAACYYLAMSLRLSAGTAWQAARLVAGRSSPAQFRGRWMRQLEFILLSPASRGVSRL